MYSNSNVDPNNYEYNPNSKIGIYIIHGFTSSTREVKDLAKYLGNNGFHAVANNLQGHGTNPEDCNRYKFTDWMQSVEQDFANLLTSNDSIFVIGLSMGSILAMHIASLFPINGAIFASSAINFQHKFQANILVPLLHKIYKYRPKKFSYPKNIRNDIKFMGYDVWPMSALNEFRKLTVHVKKELNKIQCPTLFIHSNIDLLSQKENVNFIANNISSKHKDFFWVNNIGHNLFIQSQDQNNIFLKIQSFINEYKSS